MMYTLCLIHLFTYKTLKPSVTIASEFSPFDSLIHLQDSQTLFMDFIEYVTFDSLIHLQDSQTRCDHTIPFVMFDSLIHLQDSQTKNN